MADAAPTSCKQAFDLMPTRFNKEAAKGLNAIYQFDLSGDGGGKWHVIINNDTCEVKEGPAASPSITISMTAQDYLDMLSGKLNGRHVPNGSDTTTRQTRQRGQTRRGKQCSPEHSNVGRLTPVYTGVASGPLSPTYYRT